ncbi:conjugal transfer protein [Dermabacteraceae bacterium CCM 9520]
MSFKLFQKKNEEEREAAGPEPIEGWTNLQRMTALGVSALLWGAVISGPAALVLTLNGRAPAPEKTESIQDAGMSQKVAEYGSSFVRLYLTQGRVDPSLVAPFLSDDVELPRLGRQEPLNVLAVTAGRVREVSPGRWLVDVAADVVEVPDKPARHRYYQLSVFTGRDGSIAVTSLPGLVAAPGAGRLSVEDAEEIKNKPVQAAVEDFFNAYLAGRGRVEPLLAPDVAIAAPEPTPFADVRVLSVKSIEDLPAEPKEGDEIRVFVSLQAYTDTRSAQQFSYSLELRYRERWEVSAVNKGIPVLKEKKK